MKNILERYPKLVRWLSAGAVCLVLLSFAKDFVIKLSVETIGSQALGAKVEIGRLALGIVSRKIRIENLRVHNPPGFPKGVFLTIPEISVDVDIAQAVQGRLHFPLIVFELKELKVYKNKEGKLNVDQLKAVQEQVKAMKDKNRKPQEMPEFTIDMLRLSIGSVIIEDAGKEGPPVISAYNVNVKDRVIKNVDGVPKLVSAVLFEALKPTAIRSAGMFAATTLAGAAFLPATALGVIVADDDATAQMKVSSKKVYAESLKLVKELGTVKETGAAGRITAKINGADITITVDDKGWGKSKVTVKARKYLLAQPQIAAGILYQLMQRLGVAQ